jgi:hypothetical protein
VSNWFNRHVVESGKLPLALLFFAFVVTFLIIRLSTRMIRANVKWWPGNMSSGGTHLHHVVFGIIFMLIAGVGGFTTLGNYTPWAEIFAALFGAGAALVLDEFALILHLEDVYWAEAGRTSVTTTMLAIAIVAMLLLGFSPLDLNSRGAPPGELWIVVAACLVDAALVAITLLKGKYILGLVGIVVTPLSFVGAIRIAQPDSPWARWRYTSNPRKLAAARRRQERLAGVWVRRWHRVIDLVAGAPTRPG